jgi:hypothetical protein
MFALDEALAGLVHSNSGVFGEAKLTRYADDFVFSTNRKGACSHFERGLEGLLKAHSSPKLAINSGKTRKMSRSGGSTLITGLRVKPSGEVGVHANYRDRVRLLLKLYAAGRLRSEDFEALRGHLTFVRHADPALFTRLSFKYHKYMATLLEGAVDHHAEVKLAA